jgi:hypothetical protein
LLFFKLFWLSRAETRVLDPRPKWLRFHLLGLATGHKHQIKKHGEGREKKFITQLGDMPQKRQSKHSAHLQPSSGYRHEL